MFRAVYRFYFRFAVNEKEKQSHVVTGYVCFPPTAMAAVKGLYSGPSGQLDSLE